MSDPLEKPEISSGINFIELEGQKIRFEVSGQGEPFILMHGWGCSLETVRSIAKTASQTHQVFNIDLPGFGKSPVPNETWGVEEYTALIEKFVQKLKLKNSILAGHSFGGRIGILYSSRNQVKKLILIDAAGIKPKRTLKYYIKVYSYKTCKNLVRLLFSKQKSERIISNMQNKRGSADYQAASPQLRKIFIKVVNEDLTSVLSKISAPTLLIWGALDTATPLRDAKIMEKRIPNAGLVVFDNAAHYSFLDNPFGFNAVLSSFLK